MSDDDYVFDEDSGGLVARLELRNAQANGLMTPDTLSMMEGAIAVSDQMVADEIVPFTGGPLDGPGGEAPDVAQWMADYAARNGCRTATSLETDGLLGGTAWSACDDRADVVLHTVADGGHTWPGGSGIPAIIAGHTSTAIDATQTMWQFFEEHPLRGE